MKKERGGCLNKTGQFYLFAAVVLCSAATIAYISRFAVKELLKEDFNDIKENFKVEQSRALTYFISNSSSNSEIVTNYNSFVSNFSYFCRTKAVRFEYIYMLKTENLTYLTNRFGSDISYSTTNNLSQSILESESSTELLNVNQINITAQDITYNFNFNMTIPLELKNLLRLRKGTNDIKVYTWG